MTRDDEARLSELESVVDAGLQSFVEVGNALAEIRAARLYRATHGTFEAYVRDRWNMTGARSRQLMTAASTATIVAVDNEAQARELVGLTPPTKPATSTPKPVSVPTAN